MNTNLLRLLLLTMMISIAFTGIASKSTSHTDTTILRATDTIPDANLMNGIRYIRNGKLAAAERDTLKELVTVQQKRIMNYQNEIHNFEMTVRENNRRDSTRLAQIREYSKANDIYKITLTDTQKALKEQKKRNFRNVFLSGLAILVLLTFKQ